MQTPKRKRVAIRPTQLTAKWIPVYRTSLTKEQRKTFVPLIALANARGLAPSDIVDAHITDFIAHMAAKGCNNPTSFARSAVTTWNAVAVAAPELGLKRLTPILTPHQLREQTLDGLAAPVCVAIKGFLDSNPDDVPQTRQTRANHIHYLCLSLIAQGRPPRTPADLISEASIDLLIDDPRFGGDEAVSRYRHSILNTLRQFARFIGNAARAKAIKAVQATELPKIPQAVAVGTVVKLLRFDDPDELVSLIARCAGFVRALAVTTNRRCDVAAAQDGLAVILIIETMAMREDMQDLSFDGEPRATAFGDRPTLVTPDRSAFEKKLKPNAIGLIDEYFVYATKALKRPPLWLFERLWGGRRDPSSVGRGVRIAASTPQARLTWTDLRDLSVKIAAARGHSAATIAPDAGYTLTVNFLARFDALINANVSQEFADLVLGPDFDEADCDEDEEGGDEEENCDEEQDCDV